MFSTAVLFFLISIAYAKTEQQVTLAPEKAAQLLQHALQCVTETGTDPAIIFQIRNRKYGDNDEQMKKFLSCAFKKAGVSSKKGLVRVDRMLDIYPENADKAALKKVIEECNVDGGKDPMDNAFNFFKCFQQNTPVRLKFT